MKKINENVFNPALMFGIGLFPLLIVADNLKSAVLFGLLILCALVICCLIYYAFKPIIVHSVRIPIYTLIIFSAVYFLDSVVSELFISKYNSVHALVSYLFVAVIIMFMFEHSKNEEKVKVGLKNSIILGTEYLISLAIVGAIREVLAYGKVWGVEIVTNYDGLPFFQTVVGGLLVIVVYALIYNVLSYVIRKHQKVQESLAYRYQLYLEENVKLEKVENKAEEEN